MLSFFFIIFVVLLQAWEMQGYYFLSQSSRVFTVFRSSSPSSPRNMQRMLTKKPSEVVPFKPPIVPNHEGFSSLDLNRDGRLSMQEIMQSPSTVMQHSPLIKSFLSHLRLVVTGSHRTGTSISLWNEIKSLVHMKVVVIMTLLLLS